ncbi:MAG TPA: flagellar hook assembly protein FlgD [Candidatus Sulfotelmatobacter sp.]|nr:flagellar hook assembly protein FlgD [Candidatus Sulfotelmatobacter sp.]
MISPTTQPTLFQSTTPTTSPGGQLGKDQFLELLVTQLRNQDPTSPLQPYEFAAQLAQFSTVEQLTQLNDAFSAQSQQTQLLSTLSQTQFSSGLIGREILAEGDQIQIPSSGNASVTCDVGGAGGTATLTLKDDSGHVLQTRDLGTISGGRQTLQLPADLPPGTYHVSISVSGAGGAAVPVTTYETGVVTGVQFKGGSITLQMGDLSVSLGSLVEIHPVSPPTSN